MSEVKKRVEEVIGKNKETEEKRKAIQGSVEDIEKRFGKGSIMQMGDAPVKGVEVISSGAIQIDEAIGVWGYPKGRIIEIYGPESCLDKDTFVQYEIKTKEGVRQNHKGGTIQKLYDRFHGVKRKGSGSYQRKETIDSVFYVPSINDKKCVFSNLIADVVNSGEKECFRVITTNGHEIVCTEDHKFYCGGSNWISLKELVPGLLVYVHENVPKKGRKDRVQYAEVFVRFHPNEHRKIVTANNRSGEKVYSYDRCRVKRCQLVVEADHNGLGYEEYICLLNSSGPKRLSTLWTLPKGTCVHHIDEDQRNDVLENLSVMDGAEHNRLHAMKNHNDLRFVVVQDQIQSIDLVGIRQTYDIKCFAPYNNYVANKFVVHNSGKTTMALHAVAEAQKAGGVAAFIDAEHALDPIYAGNLGVDVPNLWISQPDTGEQALEITESLIRSGGIDIIVIDSVAALTPEAEIAGDMGASHMGLQARLMSQALRKLNAIVMRTNTVLIFINQIRMKIGVVFGNPETTTGGKALKFYASVRLEVRRIETISEGKDSVGNRTRVKVVKNKVAPPFKQAEVDIVFGKGIDPWMSLLMCAAAKEIVVKAGSWYSYKEERIAQGKANAAKWLAKNLKVAEEIEDIIRNRKKVDDGKDSGA